MALPQHRGFRIRMAGRPKHLFAELTNFIAASHDRGEACALQHPLHGGPIVKKVMVVTLAKIGVDGLVGGCGLPPLREPIRLIEVGAHDPLNITHSRDERSEFS
jgi:hypothetical protein